MINLNIRIYAVRFLMIFIWICIIFLFLFISNFLPFKKEAKSINVFVWSGLYDINYIENFEKRTGIKVKFSYYESNEELLVKLGATQGKGYDLIIPSDYIVDILRKKGILKKLNKNKLEFFNKLNPLLLGHYFDPNNDYSLPAEWAVFGLGIDKNFFKGKEIIPSWKYAFDPNYIPSKIIMVNDPYVGIPLVNIFLYKSINWSLDKLNKIKDVLLKQRPYVLAYVDFRPDYYIVTKNCPLVVASSAYILRSLNQYEYVDFLIPQEGTIISIENFAIPIASEKEDLVYEFLNFLMKPETVKHHFESENSLFPVTIDALPLLKMRKSIESLLKIKKEEFKKFHFFRLDKLKEPINEQYFQDLYIKIKL